MARAIDAEKYMELLKEQYLRYKAMKHGEAARAWQGAMQLLYDMPTLTPPNECGKDNIVLTNDPLTIEELREMDGQPVWVVPKDKRSPFGGWCVVTVWKSDRYSYVNLLRDNDSGWNFERYGATWLAYRRPPEGEV